MYTGVALVAKFCILIHINVGEQGGERRKQVGSMNEESQVRGCYNFCLHQVGNSVGSPLNQMHRQQLELTDDLLLQEHWGKEDTVGPAHKF